MENETQYLCDSCGEEIVIPVDYSAGSSQEYVEDCPVCCNPNLLILTIDADGEVHISCQNEQDHA